MQWTRERYIELMTFGRAERPMFSELFGPLIGLPQEWRARDASDDEIDMVGLDWDYVLAADGPAQEYSGASLMDEGLHIELPQRYRAAVHVVTRREGTA